MDGVLPGTDAIRCKGVGAGAGKHASISCLGRHRSVSSCRHAERCCLLPLLFSSNARLLVLVLQLVETVVNASEGKEFLVGPHLADLSLVHDDNVIGRLDR